MTTISTNEIKTLCDYAANNELAFPVGEKTIDAMHDKNFLGHTLIKTHDGQDIKYNFNKKASKRADPVQIIKLCDEFEQSVNDIDYQSSFAARVIRAIRSTAYMSCVTTAKSFQSLLNTAPIAIHGEQFTLGF